MADSSENTKKRPRPNDDSATWSTKKLYMSAQSQDGQVGVLATVDRGREDRAARELIDLFNEVADLYFPLPNSNQASEVQNGEMSLEQELANEIRELKKKKPKRFEVIQSGCKNIVFIRFLDKQDPITFVNRVFQYLVEEVKKPRTRYSNRILPIQKTCSVSEEMICNTITPFIADVFHAKPVPTDDSDANVTTPQRPGPYTFMVDLRSRNNNVLDKDQMKRAIVTLVGRGHFVDLKNPKKTVLLEVFAKACGVSVLDSETMNKYKGYNIRTVSDTFGEPLPPLPPSKKQQKLQEQKLKAQAQGDKEAEAEISKAPEPETSVEPEVENEAVEGGMDSDSDSDNGGISIF